MSTITIMFKATDDGFLEEHGSKFIRFATLPQLLGWELETALNADPVCKGLVAFHYDPTSGTGHFILPDTSLFPAGRHTVRYPQPKVVTQRTVYRWQDRVRDETHTHIATGVHGFESLCCSEMLAEMVERAEISEDSKVTCPLCKIIWQDCRTFEPCDFSDGEQKTAAMPEVDEVEPEPERHISAFSVPDITPRIIKPQRYGIKHMTLDAQLREMQEIINAIPMFPREKRVKHALDAARKAGLKGDVYALKGHIFNTLLHLKMSQGWLEGSTIAPVPSLILVDNVLKPLEIIFWTATCRLWLRLTTELFEARLKLVADRLRGH